MTQVCDKCHSGIDMATKYKGTCDRCGSEGDVFRCSEGHSICARCLDADVLARVKEICMSSTSQDPVEIFGEIVADDIVRMHDYKHHVIVGSVLLAAHRNSGYVIDLDAMLSKMAERGMKVPPGACGLMGNCGAAVSVGTAMSILTGTTPLSDKWWGDINLATAQCLIEMGIIGGPRCCKRNSYVAIRVGARILRDKCGSLMTVRENIVCELSDRNQDCIKERCPFYKKG